MELKVGQRVRFHHPDSDGWFDATVDRLVTVREYWASVGKEDIASTSGDPDRVSQAVLRPVAPAVRDYVGGDGTYALGRAHWDACITALDERGA